MSQIRFPRPLAFVFSGGLARAASQIGMCQIALELGIRPDLVVGTSTGAINAAVLAHDINRYAENPALFEDAARKLWEGVADDKALSSIWRSTLRGLAGTGSSRTQTMLRKHLQRSFADTQHSDLKIEFLAATTDLATGHTAVSQSGSVVDSLLTSAAFPIIMPPTPQDGDLFIDGSVVAGVPVLQALNAGARSVLVFDTGASEVDPADIADVGWYEVLALAFTHLIRGQADHDIAIAANRVPVVVISQEHGNPFDLRAATSGIPIGREVASKTLLTFAPKPGKEFRLISRAGLYGNYPLASS